MPKKIGWITWYNLNGYAIIKMSTNIMAEFMACSKIFDAFNGCLPVLKKEMNFWIYLTKITQICTEIMYQPVIAIGCMSGTVFVSKFKVNLVLHVIGKFHILTIFYRLNRVGLSILRSSLLVKLRLYVW